MNELRAVSIGERLLGEVSNMLVRAVLLSLLSWAIVSGFGSPAARAQTVKSEPAPADELAQLAARVEAGTRKHADVQSRLERLETDRQTMEERLAQPGIGAYLGPLLEDRRRRLPEVPAITREIRLVRDEANSVHVRYLTLEDALRDLQEAASRPGSQPAAADLELLKNEYKKYWRSLVDLAVLQEQLLAETEKLAQLIDERMLWLPVAKPFYQARFPASVAPAPGTWGVLGRSALGDLRRESAWYIVILAASAAWVGACGAARRRATRIRELVQHPYTDSFRLTIDALAIAIFMAAGIPVLVWFCAWRFAACLSPQDHLVYEFGTAIAIGLNRAALNLFVVLLLKELCRPGGVAELHFRWDPDRVRRLGRGVRWLAWLGVPGAFLFNFTYYHPDALWRDTLSRPIGAVMMVAFAVFAHQLLRPRRNGGDGKARPPEARFARARERLVYMAVLAIPLSLIAGAFTPYPHTAAELGRHMYWTILLIVALAIARSFIVRFVLVSRDRTALEQAKRDRAGREEGEGEASGRDEGERPGELIPSRATIDLRTQTLLHWMVMLGLAVGVWIIWRDIFPAFRYIGEAELWTYAASGGESATVVHLGDVVFALLAGFMTLILARNAPPVIDTAWLARLPLDKATRFAIVTILRYVLVVVGVSMALGAVGLGWSRIQWLAAGITVGLGFGLQEIFANFISGLIILFEKPVRIGDIVTVGGVDGRITRIQIRATTVVDGRRRELIVPNKEFITGQIINWTLSDPVTHVDIPIGIAYGSDTRLARELLIRAAKECRHVLADPAPSALIKKFGDSTLDFELGVCIPHRDVCGEMLHDLHTRIDDEFRRAGIELAFPQRDIHIRSIPEGLMPLNPATARATSIQG